MKSPDHPVPSGDRTMARLMSKALSRAGFEPELASTLRLFHKPETDPSFADLERAAAAEASRLAAEYAGRPDALKPALWFTYHCHYKAPDLLGPAVADRLGIPYVIAEPSSAPKRAHGPHAAGHAAAEAAFGAADLLFPMTAVDAEMFDRRAVLLPPFLDLDEWPAPAPRPAQAQPRLLTVAMMRPGAKLRSYDLLATTLRCLDDRDWSLEIAGDGPARPEVERLFAGRASRVRFLGLVSGRDALARLYQEADLYVWPAVDEAYGMAFLEAQAFGAVPVAGAEGGVADVIQDGRTGLLTPPRDPSAMAAAIRSLLDDEDLRLKFSAEGQRFVRACRTVDGAAAVLGRALEPLVAGDEGARAQTDAGPP